MTLPALILLGLISFKVYLDWRRNKLMGDNNAALATLNTDFTALQTVLANILTTFTDATNAIKDLAAKAAGGQIIAPQLKTVTDQMEAALPGLQSAVTAMEGLITSEGEPVTDGTLPVSAPNPGT